eukprot:m.61731 g.61731  ORF g.61731 m.61731 type:complete len:816 (-) comp11878_c0_seq3:424-2871(-)
MSDIATRTSNAEVRHRAYSVGTGQNVREELEASEETPLMGANNMLHRKTLWDRFKDRFANPPLPPHKLRMAGQMVYESLDYELTESEVEMAERRKLTNGDHTRTSIYRWIVLLFVGILTAVVAAMIDIGIRALAQIKFDFLGKSINDCIQNDCLHQSFLYWWGINLGLVCIAACLVCFFAPIAQGSGIPEVKCYLNGIKMPEVVRLKTLMVKAIGVMFAVCGGMSVGKEGPMIHSGAVVAAGLSQGKSTSLKFLNTPFLKRFRNDLEKRDFVSGGAAAGVSAAFGAPIGGVLFSLEEGASFWNQSLTWRIFFCSMVATFTLNILLSGLNEHTWGALSNPGLINFGKFEDMPYSYVELPIYIGMGIIGGFLGALFNYINELLTIFRNKYIVVSPWLKLLEVFAICTVSVCCAFLLIFFSGDCLPLGSDPESSSPLQFFCKEHQYSAMGALMFNTPEDSIKNLFHAEGDSYKTGTLAIFAAVYWFLACITYGLAIPSGLFVPCILTGASWGRLLGTLLQIWFPNSVWVDPGKYALIGAAAMLGGVVRMTISLTVIIIEATGNVTYGLPIMLAVIFAKWTGDYFNEGLYDIHIELKHIPLLPWDPPAVAANTLSAYDFMSKDLLCIQIITKAGDLYDMLTSSPHNAFPVISWEEHTETVGDGLATLRGMVLRSQLIALLRQRGFGPRNGNRVMAKVLSVEEFGVFYPRWPKIDTVVLSEEDREQWVDIRPYMNPSPYHVLETGSLSRIFQLFRTMGLRHLVVTNLNRQLVGMITRKDIANITNDMKKEDFFSANIGCNVKYTLPDSKVIHAPIFTTED